MRVDIDESYKLEQGQGHWVKWQGHIHDLAKKILAVDHELFVGLNSNLIYMLSMILSMCCIKII